YTRLHGSRPFRLRRRQRVSLTPSGTHAFEAISTAARCLKGTGVKADFHFCSPPVLRLVYWAGYEYLLIPCPPGPHPFGELASRGPHILRGSSSHGILLFETTWCVVAFTVSLSASCSGRTG